MVALDVLFDDQVPHGLQVDLLESACHLELPPVLLVVPHRLEDLIDCSGDHTFQVLIVDVALHGVCLAWACLAIGEDAYFEAVQGWADQLLDFFEDFGLGGVVREDCVELEVIGGWSVSDAGGFAVWALGDLNGLVAVEDEEVFLWLLNVILCVQSS